MVMLLTYIFPSDKSNSTIVLDNGLLELHIHVSRVTHSINFQVNVMDIAVCVFHLNSEIIGIYIKHTRLIIF